VHCNQPVIALWFADLATLSGRLKLEPADLIPPLEGALQPSQPQPTIRVHRSDIENVLNQIAIAAEAGELGELANEILSDIENVQFTVQKRV
jgi:hypothetical protein